MEQSQSQPARFPPIAREAIDPLARKVLRRLQRHGYRAYLVGGCVRDLLLKREPKDFDIATSARPGRIRRLFRNSRIIGRRFRLVHIHFGPRVLEVSTFRAPPVRDDEEDLYIRRDNVYGTEEQDARRRDFTINGLFYDVEEERVVDHVGGLEDLRAGTLRMIGDPDLRLREDPVRILRAAKFAGRLGFRLTPQLEEATTAHAGDLEKAAPPRTLEELYRLVSGQGSRRAFHLLEELGALPVILPEITPLPEEFYESLGRLEELTEGDRDAVSQDFLLAVLFWPLVGPVLEKATLRDVDRTLRELLQPLGERLTIARRDLSGARLCLAAQLRLSTEPRGRTAKRFCRRGIFPRTLALRRIVGPVPGADAGHLREWEELAERLAEADARPQRRKRRRRRRRSRRRKALSKKAGQAKNEGCPSPSESSSAPAPKSEPSPSPTDSSNAASPPA